MRGLAARLNVLRVRLFEFLFLKVFRFCRLQVPPPVCFLTVFFTVFLRACFGDFLSQHQSVPELPEPTILFQFFWRLAK